MIARVVKSRHKSRRLKMAQSRHGAMSDLSPLCEQKRTSANHFEITGLYPGEEDHHLIVRLMSCPKSLAALKLEARL